jgi:hypothetical protein
MPGYRGREERTKKIVVRVTTQEKEHWTYYAGHEGVSALVRRAVREFLDVYPSKDKRPTLYQD